MYGYEEHIEVTTGQILQKVTQEQIFEFILERPFESSGRYLSPFRRDTKPDCRFEFRPDGTILFVDFGERFNNPRKIYRSCFSMVMDRFEKSLNSALIIICDEFGLSKKSSDYKHVSTASIYNPHYNSEHINETQIKTNRRNPLRTDVRYWSQYLIKVEEIEEDNVYCVRSFSIRNEKGLKSITPYSNCYEISFIDRVKIYQPYNEKYKWITNCNENNIGNFDNLPATGDEVIIQKSYKDHRVLRNLPMGLNVCWFMNEGCIPDLYILKSLTERFKLITIFYDNDYDGIVAAMKLYEVFDQLRPGCVRMVHLPHIIDKPALKDPGEFINKEGKQDLIHVLKFIGINGTT